MPDPKLNAIVTLRDEISPWLMILRVAADGWELPDFAPGQFAVIGLPGSVARCALSEPEERPADPSKLIRRAYSIASSSLARQFMEFYVALMTTGSLTPRLFSLKIGDRIWLGPKISGMFTFDQVPPDKNAVGSVLTCGDDRHRHGSGTVHEHVEHPPDVRQPATGHRPARRAPLVGPGLPVATDDAATLVWQLRLPAHHQPPAERACPWVGATGYVQDLWKTGALDQAWGFHPTPDNTHIFLCGAPAMIDETVAMLQGEGFKEQTKKVAGEIHVERYW